jgi:hypothetical protein
MERGQPRRPNPRTLMKIESWQLAWLQGLRKRCWAGSTCKYPDPTPPHHVRLRSRHPNSHAPPPPPPPPLERSSLPPALLRPRRHPHSHSHGRRAASGGGWTSNGRAGGSRSRRRTVAVAGAGGGEEGWRHCAGAAKGGGLAWGAAGV